MATKSFEDFYKSELEPLLQPLEKQRRELQNLTYRAILFGLLSVVLLIVAFQAQNIILGLLFITALIATIISLVKYYSQEKEYVSSFKETIIRRIINYIDPSFQYNPKACINEDDYGRSGLFLTNYDRYKGDDYVEGKREKTYFCFSELHTEHEVKSGKSSHWETIFKGLFFIGDFNKNFQGRTYVWSESNPQLGFFGKLFSSFARDLEKVKLESSEFENRFIVYSNDQVEARYILTPSLMERMVKLQSMMGEGLSLSFVNTNINVAVPITGVLFEPSIFKPNNYESLGDYYNTMYIVFDIMDELNLDLRIWNKT